MHMKTVACMLSAVAISGTAAQSTNGSVTTGALGDATAVTNNPSGAQYMATLPDTAFDKTAFPNGGNVNGSIQAVSMPDGHGVMFHISFSNLPNSGGPFIYHIHDQPVPADGNCTGTLAHLDPFQRGEAPPCDASRPETCQVGDLSGKHGSITATGGDNNSSSSNSSGSGTFTATYTDDFASTLDGIGAFFGNRSFVLHFANATRITCANFVAVGSGSSCGSGTNTTTTTSSSSSSSSASRATTTTTTTTTAGTPTSTSTSSASPTFATAAAAHARAPARQLVAGAAVLAFLL